MELLKKANTKKWASKYNSTEREYHFQEDAYVKKYMCWDVL